MAGFCLWGFCLETRRQRSLTKSFALWEKVARDSVTVEGLSAVISTPESGQAPAIRPAKRSKM